MGLGEFGGDLVERLRLAEADHHDRAEAALSEFTHRLLALTVVLNFKFLVGCPGILLELLGPPIGALVEAFVIFAADVVDDRRLDLPGKRRTCRQCRNGNGRQQLPDHVNEPPWFVCAS